LSASTPEDRLRPPASFVTLPLHNEGERRHREAACFAAALSAPVKISIIVPAFNEERLLPATLEIIAAAARAFEQAGWSSELIVCDNNSTDRTAQIAAAAGARVVFEPLNQISRARNAGAAVATGEWLVFIDADSHPSAALFADVVRAIERGDCIAGGSTVTVDSTLVLARITVSVWNRLSRATRWLAGSFIFCDNAVFRRLGGFSERLYAAEELDLSRRLKRLARHDGKRILVLHRHPLMTSARKAHLYSWRDALRFYSRLILTGGRALRTRDGAFIWYDGRR
jgi:glycosyltransferase involved in cell wall biosynthesis